MGLFDKLKNVFIEEDFEEELPKKEVVVEKTEPKIEKVEVQKEEPVNTFPESTLTNTKEKFKFPVIFEDEDFKEEPKKKSINVLERENTKYEPEREVRKEKKLFKPSPVISPVYGVLDKNYTKDEIATKDGLFSDEDKVDIDYVIKKASGEYKSKKSEEIKIEKVEDTVDLFNQIEKEEFTTKEIDLPDESTLETQEEIDEKIKSIDELLKDTSDEDFYSLVDSMYKDDTEEE